MPAYDELLLGAQPPPDLRELFVELRGSSVGMLRGVWVPSTFDPGFPQAIAFCSDCQQHRFALADGAKLRVCEALVSVIVSLKYEEIAPLGKWFARRSLLTAKEANARLRSLRLKVLFIGSRVPPENTCCEPKDVAKWYVALLLYAKAAGLTIYRSCC